MRIGSKHSNEWDGTLSTFQGGLDKSKPPFLIDQESLVEATNWYYDPLSGYLTTRPGLVRWSASVVSGAPEVLAISQFPVSGTERMVLACSDQKLYYLDGTKTPQLIGSLTGTQRPSFTRMAGKLVICSGGALQTWDGVTLVTTTSPNLNYVSDMAVRDVARVVGVGPTNVDRLYLSGSGDPTNWTFGATPESDAKYIDAGYIDGGKLAAVANIKGYLYGFKRADDVSLKRLYRMDVRQSSPYWSSLLVSRQHTAMSPHLVVELGENVLFVDKQGPKTLAVVESMSELAFTVNDAGNKIAAAMRPYIAADGFAVYDPVFGLVMIKPTKNSDLFYCIDVIGGRWTYFRYGVNIQSGANVLGGMYFGGNDGYVYAYDTTQYKDNGVDYQKVIETRWFNLFPMYREVVKGAELDIIGLLDGTISAQMKNKGSVIGNAITHNFGATWWSWATVNAILPSAWTESLTKEVYDTFVITEHMPGDFLSFQVSVDSGLAAVAQLRVRVAQSGRT